MSTSKEKILFCLLSALGIAFIFSLPRVVIALYIQFNYGNNISADTQSKIIDHAIKFSYTYVVALVFLWLNTTRKTWQYYSIKINTYNFYIRLLLNIILFIAVRYISINLNMHLAAIPMVPKFHFFLFHISLTLEVLFCLFIAEIYMLIKRNQQISLNNEILLKSHAEASYEALKNQINPHFLFNSFNTIQSLIDVNSQAAKQFISNLSTVYRNILNSFHKPVISLNEELQSLRAYLDMMQERHNGNLQVTLNIQRHHLDKFLPPISLQLLVENAIKHNEVSNRRPLTIIIESEDKYIQVKNQLQPKKTAEPSTGKGLYNLNQQYQHICNQSIQIRKTGEWFIVILPLLQQQNIS
jgi:Putative regulator of cell autolysis